jgi:hypothetical protein
LFRGYHKQLGISPPHGERYDDYPKTDSLVSAQEEVGYILRYAAYPYPTHLKSVPPNTLIVYNRRPVSKPASHCYLYVSRPYPPVYQIYPTPTARIIHSQQQQPNALEPNLFTRSTNPAPLDMTPDLHNQPRGLHNQPRSIILLQPLQRTQRPATLCQLPVSSQPASPS